MRVSVSAEGTMADQEPTEEIAPTEEDFGFWNNDPRTAPEHYIKASDVKSSRSDVTLLLGNTYWDGRDRVDLCKLRLIMSHYDFLEFAEDVRKQAAFLEKIYKGNAPGPDATDEEFNIAWEEVYGDD